MLGGGDGGDPNRMDAAGRPGFGDDQVMVAARHRHVLSNRRNGTKIHVRSDTISASGFTSRMVVLLIEKASGAR
jgi:hypothetical protein